MDIYTLFSKYLSGQATAEEKAELDAWRRCDVLHEKEFQELSEVWNLTDTYSHYVLPHKEKVWNKIVSNIHHTTSVKSYSRTIFYRTISMVATAALLIGFSLSLLFSQLEESKLVTITAPKGQKAEIGLPDGTAVCLNSGSTLSYSTNYGRSDRSVTLMGQAFFDVVKDIDHSFNVSVGNVKVIVHGTSFDINAYTDNSQIAVTLLSGSVSIMSVTSEKLLAKMKPNQKALIPFYDKDKCTLIACNAQEETLWRLGKLKIDGEELFDVVRKMERWYGVNITVNNVNTIKHYWMTIKTESLKEMLEIINRITPIDYSINGEEVIITYR